MPSVDTNVVLRWLLNDVPEQTERVNALFSSGQRFDVDDATVIEVVYVLERALRLSRGTVTEAIRTLLSEASMNLDREHWSVALTYFEQHPKLSITDIHLALRAAERSETLFTFDAKLISQLATMTSPVP